MLASHSLGGWYVKHTYNMDNLWGRHLHVLTLKKASKKGSQSPWRQFVGRPKRDRSKGQRLQNAKAPASIGTKIIITNKKLVAFSGCMEQPSSVAISPAKPQWKKTITKFPCNNKMKSGNSSQTQRKERIEKPLRLKQLVHPLLLLLKQFQMPFQC